MPKPTKEELLDALKDEGTLRELGLKKTDDPLEELMKPIEVTDDMTTADVVRITNERNVKLIKHMQGMQGEAKKEAQSVLEDDRDATRKKEVDEFLKTHPELAKNEALLDIVEPLYHKSGNLKDAWSKGCKMLDLDADTGLVPDKEGKKEEKGTGKKTQLKTDDLGTDKADKAESKATDAEDEPKSIREILSENSNDMAAKGNNPYRDS